MKSDACIGVLLADLHFPANRSLKDKRAPLHSLRDALHTRFSASFSEVGGQDKWQGARVLVVLAASSLQQATRTARRHRPLPSRAALRGGARAAQDDRPGGRAVGHRLLRINESIKETLSSVIAAEGLKDPRVGFVTVTGVETTPDLRHAKVFVSVLGKQAAREQTMDALEASRGFLQGRLNESLHMKRTPQLQFVYDETLDRAMRIERLLKQEEQVLGSEPPVFDDDEGEA